MLWRSARRSAAPCRAASSHARGAAPRSAVSWSRSSSSASRARTQLAAMLLVQVFLTKRHAPNEPFMHLGLRRRAMLRAL
eukprot:1339820-Prymnesium_polylepis.1